MILLKILEYTVNRDEEALRVDKFLYNQLPRYSRTFFQKLIDNGQVTVNGASVKSSFKVSSGDVIRLEIPPPVETGIEAENIPLKIIYQDKDIIVIDKPAGMVVHPGAGVKSGTLVNALLYHCKDLSGIGGRLRPGIVHRLDKNTSGVLVVAKNDQAHIHLAKQLQERSMGREYTALVWHNLPDDQGEIDTTLNRSKKDRKKFTVTRQGRRAVTHFRVIRRFGFLTLMRIRLETGRTHQIRVHLNHIHHPVFGDPDYNGRTKQLSQVGKQSDRLLAKELLGNIDRQALHAGYLKLMHPSSGELLEFESPLPDDISTVLNKLNTRMDQVRI